MICWKIGLLLLALIVSIDAIRIKPQAAQSNPDNPVTGWFQQPLDHFTKSNTNTWKQRYFVIESFHKQGGPAFLFLEGEYEAWPGYLNGYAAKDYAKKLNALLFGLEHRYYGKSTATSDLSMENLKYLTIEQVLEDIVSFIAGMNTQYKLPQDTKWIVFGTSYPATLATWVRSKYPDVVYAAVAYSAPIQPKLDFWEYKEHVQRVIEGFDKNCLDAIKQGHAQLKATIAGSGDLSGLVNKYKLCDPVDRSNAGDVQGLIAVAASNLCGVVQYKTSWSLSLKEVCDVMTDSSRGDFIDRYGEVAILILKETGTSCLDYTYEPYIASAKNVSLGSNGLINEARQFVYQSCTTFANFQPSYKKTHMFSEDIPLSYFTQQCVDIFGKEYDQKHIQAGVDRTNKVYGGVNIKTTRVAFVNGDWDPWMELSITKTKIPESPAILVKGESHGACQSSVKATDSNEYKAACKQVEDLVTKWCTE